MTGLASVLALLLLSVPLLLRAAADALPWRQRRDGDGSDEAFPFFALVAAGPNVGSGPSRSLQLQPDMGAKGDVWKDWPILIVLALGLVLVIALPYAWRRINQDPFQPLTFLTKRRDLELFCAPRSERVAEGLTFPAFSSAVLKWHKAPSLASKALHTAVLAGWDFVLGIGLFSLFVSWWVRATVELKTESGEPFFEDRATRANLGACQKVLEVVLPLTCFMLGLSVFERLQWTHQVMEHAGACQARLHEIALVAGGVLCDHTEEVIRAKWMLYRYLNVFHLHTYSAASALVEENVARCHLSDGFEKLSLLTGAEAESLRAAEDPLEMLALWISHLIMEVGRAREAEIHCLQPLIKALMALRSASVALPRRLQFKSPISFAQLLQIMADVTAFLSPLALAGSFHPEHDATSIYLWPCLGSVLVSCVFHGALGIVWATQDPFDPGVGWGDPDVTLMETDMHIFELLAGQGSTVPDMPNVGMVQGRTSRYGDGGNGGAGSELLPHLGSDFHAGSQSAGLTWATMSLRDLVGDWLSSTDRVWTVHEDGTLLFEGKHLVAEYDLVEEKLPDGHVQIRRRDGWVVDARDSNADLLTWTRRGDRSVVWRRAQGGAWLSLRSLSGDWLSRASDGLITIVEDGKLYLDGRLVGDVSAENREQGVVVVKRTGGWRVDTERSTPHRLIWYRPNDTDVLWERAEDQESVTGSFYSSVATDSEFMEDYGRGGRGYRASGSNSHGRYPPRGGGWEVAHHDRFRASFAGYGPSNVEVSEADAEELLVLLNEWVAPPQPVRLDDNTLQRFTDISRRQSLKIKKVLANVTKATLHRSRGSTATGWGDSQRLVGDILARLNEESKVTLGLRNQLATVLAKQNPVVPPPLPVPARPPGVGTLQPLMDRPTRGNSPPMDRLGGSSPTRKGPRGLADRPFDQRSSAGSHSSGGSQSDSSQRGLRRGLTKDGIVK